MPTLFSRALLWCSRVTCLLLRTTSLAKILADLTSFLSASAFSCERALLRAASSCGRATAVGRGREAQGGEFRVYKSARAASRVVRFKADLSDLLIELALLALDLTLPLLELLRGRLAVQVVSDRFPARAQREIISICSIEFVKLALART